MLSGMGWWCDELFSTYKVQIIWQLSRRKLKEKGKLDITKRVGLLEPSVLTKRLFPPKRAGTKI